MNSFDFEHGRALEHFAHTHAEEFLIWPRWGDLIDNENEVMDETHPLWTPLSTEEIPPPYIKVERLQVYHYAPTDWASVLAPPSYKP